MTTNQNTVTLKCLLLFYATMNHFLIGLWCAMKNGFYMTTGDDPLTQWLDWEEAPKHFLKPTLHPRKVMVTVWLPVWSLQLSESWQNHYIWKVCSASQWDALKTRKSRTWLSSWTKLYWKLQCLQLASVNRMGPVFLHSTWPHVTQPTLQKLNKLGYKDFASSAIFTWPLANWLPLLETSWQLFAGKMLPQPAGGRKCFLRVHGILKHELFMLRE